MSLRDRAIRGAGWSIVASGGNHFASLIVLMVLARLLGPEQFGLVGFASIFTAFLAVFLSYGFGEALIQRREVEPEHIDTAFWTVMASGCCLALLGQGLALGIALLRHSAFVQSNPDLILNNADLDSVVHVLSLGFVIGSMRMLPVANLRRQMQFKTIAIRTLFASVFGGALGIGMAIRGYGVWSLVAHRLSADLIGTLLLWPASSWRPHFRYSPAHFKELFAFGRNILGIRFLTFANRWSDHLLIGVFLGDVALGYYTVASRAVIMMRQLLLQSVQRVALPTFSRLQGDPERIRRAIYMATQACSIVAFPAFLGIAALAPEIVAIAGDHWLLAAPVARMLAVLGLMNAVNAVNSAVMQGLGRPHWVLWLRLMNVTGNVIAFALVVKWGIVAVATAFVVRGYLLAPVQLLMMKRLSGIHLPTYLRHFVPPLVAGLALVGTTLGIRTFTDGMVWHHDTAISETIDPNTSYRLRLVLDGTTATLFVNEDEKTTFDFHEPLTDGALGLGTNNARAQFDNIVVQVDDTKRCFETDFADGKAESFEIKSGNWSVRQVGLRVIEAKPKVGNDALAILQIPDPLPNRLEFLAMINAHPSSGGYIGNATLIFDYAGPADFKFAGAKIIGDKWVIGHSKEFLGLYVSLGIAVSAGVAVYLLLIVWMSPFVRQQLFQVFGAKPGQR